MKKKVIWISISFLLLIIIILSAFFISSYQYHQYWEKEERCHSVDYYSDAQARDSGQTNLLIQNKENPYGEFLSGQILYKDDFIISFDIYRQSPKSLLCVTQFILEAEKLNQYKYQLEIFHNTNLVPVQHTQRVESVDKLENAILLEEKEATLQRAQQCMFIYADITAKNHPVKNDISVCYTYITEFQMNYSEKSYNPEFKLNLNVISDKNYEQLTTYSLSKLLYNIQ